jgi:hypothetical protein
MMDEKELERRERAADRDIVRHEAVHPGCNERYWYEGYQRLEAELTEAQALISSLRAALEPFAREAREKAELIARGHLERRVSIGVSLADLRRAAEVLKHDLEH